MTEEKEEYEYIKAIIDCGELSFNYKLKGCPPNSMIHDEDVTDWSEDDIKSVTQTSLTLSDDELDRIEIEYY